MGGFVVKAEHLTTLATAQDQTADELAAAAAAASNLSTQVWVSHGISSGFSNVAFTKAEGARRAAGDAMKEASSGLAVNLLAARDVYQSIDEQTAENIDKQVVER